jgi:hypothetical protein
VGISRFVQPESVRIYLADVHRRAHEALLKRTKPKSLKDQQRLTDEITESAARLAFAEEQGDWIEVKKRLNTGEQRAAFARLYVSTADGRMRVNPLEAGMVQASAHLVDWSLSEFPIRGKSVEEIESALNALDPDDFAEIRQAVEAHADATQAERDAEKKTTLTGASASSATSLSASSSGVGTTALPN